MAKYFNFFPRTTYYKNKDSTSVDIITNITTRYNFNDALKQNAATYYKYKIKVASIGRVLFPAINRALTFIRLYCLQVNT